MGRIMELWMNYGHLRFLRWFILDYYKLLTSALLLENSTEKHIASYIYERVYTYAFIHIYTYMNMYMYCSIKIWKFNSLDS